jgi:hypothetical protein
MSARNLYAVYVLQNVTADTVHQPMKYTFMILK